jgi:hypothetical protein
MSYIKVNLLLLLHVNSEVDFWYRYLIARLACEDGDSSLLSLDSSRGESDRSWSNGTTDDSKYKGISDGSSGTVDSSASMGIAGGSCDRSCVLEDGTVEVEEYAWSENLTAKSTR